MVKFAKVGAAQDDDIFFSPLKIIDLLIRVVPVF